MPRTVSRVPSAPPWEVWFVPVDAFPISDRDRSALRDFIDRFTTQLCAAAKLEIEYFIQFNHLHHENGPRRLSQHGPRWMPQLGLGVWPDREPPSLWTMEEFQNLAPGEVARPLMHQVFRVAGHVSEKHNARNEMFGIGAGLQVFLDSGDKDFVERTTRLLLPRIEEPSFQAFEFYVPLLELKSVEAAQNDTLDEWLCGAQGYLRESPEDGGIIITSSVALSEIWKTMRLVEGSEPQVWILPT